MLIKRLRRGDEDAFVELVERFEGPLRGFLRSFVPSDDLAEDLAQETWMTVVTALERFEGRSSLKTWIFRIGAN